MSLTFMGAAGLTAGLLALGGIVFLLQRLRVRRRRVVVPTTIFWAQAQKETQARRLTERFRLPLVFALLFAICALLWLAIAGPMRKAAPGQYTLILVDASAAMARQADGGPGTPTRFDVALDRATELLDKLPAQRRSLLVANTGTTPLLLSNEAVELLEVRRAQLKTPTGLSAALVDLVAQLVNARRTPARADQPTSGVNPWQNGQATNLIAIGSPPALAGLQELCAQDTKLNLQTLSIPAANLPNEGILALGASPAASGTPGLVDLLVETTGSQPELTAAGQALPLEARSTGVFTTTDVPLDGALIVARLNSEDALAADNQAQLQLPVQAPLLVFLDPDLDAAWQAAFSAALRADRGLQSASQIDAQVEITSSATPASDRPRLVVIPANGHDQDRAGILEVRRPQAHQAFRPLFASLALELLGTALPTPSQERPASRLELNEQTQDGPASIGLPQNLIAPPYELAGEPRFALLVSLGLRWLADDQPTGRFIVAEDLVGRDITQESTDSAASRAALDLKTTGKRRELWPLLALVALLLLGLEWFLTSTRRIP